MKRNITCIVTSMIIVFGLCACQTATVNIQSETIENKETIGKEEVAPTEIAEEIVTPTPTPEPTETPIPEPVQEEEAEVSENENNNDIKEEVDELTARTESLDKTMYAVSAVNTRAGDNTKYEKVGSLTFGQEVKVTGKSSESGWFRIQNADGTEAYVSNKYLSESKPQAQQKSSQSEKKAAQTGDINQSSNNGGGFTGRKDGKGVQVTTSGTAQNNLATGALAGMGLH